MPGCFELQDSNRLSEAPAFDEALARLVTSPPSIAGASPSSAGCQPGRLCHDESAAGAVDAVRDLAARIVGMRAMPDARLGLGDG
jgi:hypothetical protein